MIESNLLDVPRGLDGVVVDTTAISDVDGQAGTLSYRGDSIDDLVKQPFSEIAVRLVFGQSRPDLAARLDLPGELTSGDLKLLGAVEPGLHPMHVLQGALPLLDTAGRFDPETDAGVGLNLAVKIPAILAYHLCRERGSHLGTSDAEDTNQRFLDYIGAPADPALRRAFATMQILQLEHSFNASTFAARVVASTLAPIQNALAAGIGTLHGVLHGGADQAALETADQVGSPKLAAAFVDECLREKRKVMGMGHREYQVVDPRAKYAKSLAAEVTAGTDHAVTYKILEAIEARFVERMAEKGKPLYANIEFYKGLIFRVLGLPTHYFTAMFAMARVYGYIAHVVESRQDNRLIRPAARYQPPHEITQKNALVS